MKKGLQLTLTTGVYIFFSNNTLTHTLQYPAHGQIQVSMHKPGTDDGIHGHSPMCWAGPDQSSVENVPCLLSGDLMLLKAHQQGRCSMCSLSCASLEWLWPWAWAGV